MSYEFNKNLPVDYFNKIHQTSHFDCKHQTYIFVNIVCTKKERHLKITKLDVHDVIPNIRVYACLL